MSPEYVFFRMNGSGVVALGEAFSLPDDAAATQYAIEMQHENAVEIWSGKRKVGIVEPQRANPYFLG